jgi:hypothetical protein
MNSIPINASFIAAIVAASTPALADDTPSKPAGINVLLEVRASDDERQRPQPIEVVLTLLDRHGCAEASERRRDAEYGFKVCSEADSPALSFHLERTRHLSEGSEHRQFKVRATFVYGKPITIARFVEGARMMEVKATVRAPSAISSRETADR